MEHNEETMDVKAEKPRWRSKEQVIEAVRGICPSPLTSSAYVKFAKEHPEYQLPSFPILKKWIGTWHEVMYQVWGILLPIWNRESILSAVSAHFPERVTWTIYQKAQAQSKSLPNFPMIKKFFGSWVLLGEELWGEADAWTPEAAIQAIQDYFKTRPTSAVYREEIVGQQGELILPTITHCEKLFGSWRHTMDIAFEGVPLSFQAVEKKSRLSDEELIHLMRKNFPDRPPMGVYAKKSRKYHWLPNEKTYMSRFGSWELAMKRCYPNEAGFNQGLKWDQEEALTCLEQAYLELGENISPTRYQAWQQAQHRAPSLNTLVRLFGSFKEAAKQLGYETPSVPSWSDLAIQDALSNYFNQQVVEGNLPSVYDYEDWLERHPGEYPSLLCIRRMYGSWRQAVRAHCHWLTEEQVKDYVLKQTEETCLQALKQAYQVLGDPLTRTRYHHYQKQQLALGEEIASSYQIYMRFGSWRSALEQAGIQSFSYQHVQTQFQKQLVHAELQENTLSEFLDWCLT